MKIQSIIWKEKELITSKYKSRTERQQAENQACNDTLAPLAFLGCLFNFAHSKFFFFSVFPNVTVEKKMFAIY